MTWDREGWEQRIGQWVKGKTGERWEKHHEQGDSRATAFAMELSDRIPAEPPAGK